MTWISSFVLLAAHVAVCRDALAQPRCVLEPGLRQAADRLEAAVGLDFGEIDLAGPAIVARAVGELEAAKVEASALLNGFDECLAGRLAVDLLENRDDRAADQVAFKRDESGLGVGCARLQCCLVACNDRDRSVLRERYHLGHDSALAPATELLGERFGADEGDVDTGGVEL